MKKFKVELINIASDIVEVKAKTLEEAKTKALENPEKYGVDFNQYNDDCLRVVISQCSKYSSDVGCTETTFLHEED